MMRWMALVVWVRLAGSACDVPRAGPETSPLAHWRSTWIAL
jgi:hypothetical protein